MFQDPIILIATVGCLIVLAILMVGLGTFAKGGETSRKYSNKLMRMRIIAQALAVIVIVFVAWAKSGGQ